MLMEKTSAKFEIIHEIISQKDNLQSVKELCKLAVVSRSAYYNWVASEFERRSRQAGF